MNMCVSIICVNIWSNQYLTKQVQATYMLDESNINIQKVVLTPSELSCLRCMIRYTLQPSAAAIEVKHSHDGRSFADHTTSNRWASSSTWLIPARGPK